MTGIREMDRDIQGIREMAKRYRGITDADLAKACGISASTIQHKASNKELPLLSYFSVAQMADLAGKRIVFVDK